MRSRYTNPSRGDFPLLLGAGTIWGGRRVRPQRGRGVVSQDGSGSASGRSSVSASHPGSEPLSLFPARDQWAGLMRSHLRTIFARVSLFCRMPNWTSDAPPGGGRGGRGGRQSTSVVAASVSAGLPFLEIRLVPGAARILHSIESPLPRRSLGAPSFRCSPSCCGAAERVGKSKEKEQGQGKGGN